MARNKANVVCLIVCFLIVVLSFADDDYGSDAVSYDRNTFQSSITKKKHFVMFFAPWCGHCKRLAPTWNELAKMFNNDESSVTIAKVDCTIETAVCSEHDVTGYPTLKFFNKRADDFKRYKGDRDLDSLQKFVEEQTSKPERIGDESLPEEKELVVELTQDTFHDFIKEGIHFVKFFAPWCGHCKKLAPTWEELAKLFADNKQVSISKVDCTVKGDLCVTNEVMGYPSMILFNNGQKVEHYKNGRTLEELKGFLNSKLQELLGTSYGFQEEAVPEEEHEEGVVDLTDNNFDSTIAEGLTFVKFFAPWCGHCKRLAPTWEELGTANVDKPVTIARLDCTQYKAVCDSQSVSGYPTLMIYQNGVRLDNYKGDRTLKSLQQYVDVFLIHTEL